MKLAVVGSGLALALAAGMAEAQSPSSGDNCIYWWGEYVAEAEEAEWRLNEGWDLVSGSPDAAFDSFNWASSRASSWINFGACPNHTTLTNRDIDDIEDWRDDIERSADCGMEVAQLMREVIETEDSIERYNADTLSGSSLWQQAGVMMGFSENVIYSWACETNGGARDFARDMLSWGREIQSAVN